MICLVGIGVCFQSVSCAVGSSAASLGVSGGVWDDSSSLEETIEGTIGE